MEVKEYGVIWRATVVAANAEEAAKLAQVAMRDTSRNFDIFSVEADGKEVAAMTLPVHKRG